MLFVFLAGVMPKEYLHSMLVDHHDTEHGHYQKDELVVGSKHTHCSFLHFDFGPFVASERLTVRFVEFLVHTPSYACYYSFLFVAYHDSTQLRGPPASSSIG